VKQFLQAKTFLPVLVVALVILFSLTDHAYAFDAEQQAKSVLKFIALVILIAAGAGAFTMLARGLIAQALVMVVAASLLYFLLGSPEVIQNIGSGLSNLLFGSGGES
jgi:hypothetical protein